MLQTFIVYVEDKPGVLNRVASLFRRRSYNIESLTVGHTHNPGISRMTIVVKADDLTAVRIEANLYKLVNVLRVDNITEEPSIIRDLALIKVRATMQTRPEILQLVEAFQARAVDITAESLIVEVTGSEDTITNMVDVLAPYGIIEMARAGLVGMGRGSTAPTLNPAFVEATVSDEAAAK